jgi:hypothetical protein
MGHGYHGRAGESVSESLWRTVGSPHRNPADQIKHGQHVNYPAHRTQDDRSRCTVAQTLSDSVHQSSRPYDGSIVGQLLAVTVQQLVHVWLLLHDLLS